MPPHRAAVAAAAAALLVALAWSLLPDPGAPRPGAVDPIAAGPAAPAAGALPPQPAAGDEHAPARSPVAAGPIATGPHAAPAGPTLRVRLRGLHPEAPWTATLHLDVDGRDDARDQWLDHDASAVPDAGGAATFVLPAWAGAAREGRIRAEDPNYRPLAHRWDGAPPADELLLDVQVVALLTGRVVDEQRQPVPAARLTVFAWRDGAPVDGELAQANSEADGTFRLSIPPDVPLWLLATPLLAATGRGYRGPGAGVRDTGSMRADLLPVGRAVRGAVGAPARLDDLVLARSARLVGAVRWQDGAPVALATVQTRPHDGTTLRVTSATSVQHHADGRLSPVASADSADDGTFELPAVAGAPLLVAVTTLPDTVLLSPLQQAAVAPQRVDFLVPRPVRLVAVHRDRSVAGAMVEIEGWRPVAADGHGAVAVVLNQPGRVRARHGRLCSPWLGVPPDAAGTTVELALAEALVPLAIEFDGEWRVRNTVVEWHRLDDSGDRASGREHLLRDDRGDPFRLFLPSGRYRLRAGPGGGERNGVFLLPVEREVELVAEPVALRLPAAFGGMLTVMATDGRGLFVGGTCRVVGQDGTDHTGRFRRSLDGDGGQHYGVPGELLPGGVNTLEPILPAGEYELLLEFPQHGIERRRITVGAREVSEVRLRLP